MRRAGALVFVILLIGGLSAGCGQRGKAWCRVFAEPFEAELQGEAHGVAFAARFCSLGDGAATLTFYAPATLAGTTWTRDENGRVTATAGEVTVGAAGLDDLFLLFPTVDETEKATVTDEGHTRVTGAGFFVEFLPDGTPYLVGRGDIEVVVVQFKTLAKAG